MSAMCCWLVGVLSSIDSVALRAPSAFGVNPIVIVQLASGASPAVGQVVAVSANSARSDEVALRNSGFVWPVFLMVRLLVILSPTGELPSASDAATVIVVGAFAISYTVPLAPVPKDPPSKVEP